MNKDKYVNCTSADDSVTILHLGDVNGSMQSPLPERKSQIEVIKNRPIARYQDFHSIKEKSICY